MPLVFCRVAAVERRCRRGEEKRTPPSAARITRAAMHPPAFFAHATPYAAHKHGARRLRRAFVQRNSMRRSRLRQCAWPRRREVRAKDTQERFFLHAQHQPINNAAVAAAPYCTSVLMPATHSRYGAYRHAAFAVVVGADAPR